MDVSSCLQAEVTPGEEERVHVSTDHPQRQPSAGPSSPLSGSVLLRRRLVAPQARNPQRHRLCCGDSLLWEPFRHQHLSSFLYGNLGKGWNISEGILPDIHVSTFSTHSRGAVVTNVLKVFKCWQIQFSFEGCQQFYGSKSHLQSKGESLALTFEKWRLLWIYEKGSLKCFLSNCCWGAWGISQVPRLRKASSSGADGFLSTCCM